VTSYAYTTGATYVATVSPAFGAAAAAGYCTVNGGGSVGATGATGATGVTGATGSFGGTVNAKTGSYNPVTGDCGNVITVIDASNWTSALPQAGSAGFAAGCLLTFINGTTGGIGQFTSTTSVFVPNGASGTAYWFAGLGVTTRFLSDGTNWNVTAPFPQTLYIKQADSCLSAVATANQTIGIASITSGTTSCVLATSIQTFTTGSFTFPANFFNATTQVSIVDDFAVTAGSSLANLTFTVAMGSTPTNVFVSLAGAMLGSVSQTNAGVTQQIFMSGTAAPSGSAAIIASGGPRGFLVSPFGTTWFGTSLATNGTLALIQEGTFTAVAGNWADLYKTIIQWVSY
jgi:hypothetical protein